MRVLIWDFDGTLAYHKRGSWSGSMLHCLEQAAPELKVGKAVLQEQRRILLTMATGTG